jgi:hypothetical protein
MAILGIRSVRLLDQTKLFHSPFPVPPGKEEGKIRHLELTPMGPAFRAAKKTAGLTGRDQLHQTFAVNKHPAMKLSGRICCIT